MILSYSAVMYLQTVASHSAFQKDRAVRSDGWVQNGTKKGIGSP
uniref:Uncharacterized protein n=1 Tax=Faecalibaculum rodentium TaxID=1702221 RepID=A0A140DU51_9FIRM|nr:hypothetical protein AALO17_10440 [Faecalibaculum rodentium]